MEDNKTDEINDDRFSLDRFEKILEELHGDSDNMSYDTFCRMLVEIMKLFSIFGKAIALGFSGKDLPHSSFRCLRKRENFEDQPCQAHRRDQDSVRDSQD